MKILDVTYNKPKEVTNVWYSCLRWKATIENTEGKTLVVPYIQGLGHLPASLKWVTDTRRTIYIEEVLTFVLKTGKYDPFFTDLGEAHSPYRSVPLSAPAHDEIIEAVFCDAGLVEGVSFEEWCDSLGLNSDSIKDRNTYLHCLEVYNFVKNEPEYLNFKEDK